MSTENHYVERCRELGVEPEPGKVASFDQLGAHLRDVTTALQSYADNLRDEARNPEPTTRKRWWQR